MLDLHDQDDIKIIHVHAHAVLGLPPPNALLQLLLCREFTPNITAIQTCI